MTFGLVMGLGLGLRQSPTEILLKLGCHMVVIWFLCMPL